MHNIENELKDLLEEVVAYNARPNKSISKRIRTKLGSLKLQITAIRAKLMELDKAGYN